MGEVGARMTPPPTMANTFIGGVDVTDRTRGPDVLTVATQSPTLVERFWERVYPTTGCWVWVGGRSGYEPHQYGEIFYGWLPDGRKTKAKAHRVAWMLVTGEAPDPSLDVDHLCRTRLCVNPGHLELVSRRENLARGHGVDRHLTWTAARTHCKRGHELTEANTYRPAGTRVRACRACAALRQRRYRSEVH